MKNCSKKTKKEVNASQVNVSSKEVQFIQSKMKILKEEFNKKESRWNNTFKKLQERIKTLEKENQNLHVENHKLKLKNPSSKVYKEFKKVGKGTDEIDEEISLDDEKINEESSSSKTQGIDLQKSQTRVEMNKIKSPIHNYQRSTQIHQAQSNKDVSLSGVESLDSEITLVDNSLASKTSDNATLVDECKDDVIKVYYYNGDVKINEISEKIVQYYYSKTKTWHLTYTDKEVFKFENGQQEIRYKDGTHEIIFTDGSVKKVLPNKSELIIFPDKTRVNVTVDGHKVISFPNGQVETHMPEYKKRQYTDGTVKILHNDGKTGDQIFQWQSKNKKQRWQSNL
ncbi:CENPJ [Lepeophtheirus salmonis]|uniref:CENPJ n=1 Tax=Lepeophtheirus salmonis TaxID=72036 RepID=A0A7R8CWZ8_LEPSM|nr:CENPJ [Lepeophtheirus salmonis]CAF2956989.1 CENPJ [Lepeophtheirus salmonis]